MSGVLLICVSLMVSAGAAGDLDMDALPFSVNEVVEQASRSTRLNYHGNLPVNSRGSTTSWPLLDEFMIDTSIVYTDPFYNQMAASVAFDGTNYLVVWGDDRGGGRSDIYGARVSPTGTVLDPSGIAVCTADHDQRHPSLSFDGSNYLVVWEDLRNGSASDIYAARVKTSGTVLDSSGIPIWIGARLPGRPSVAFGGASYFVVWKDEGNGTGSDIYGVRVDTSGAVLDTSRIAICTENEYQSRPCISFDGIDYLIVWQDNRNGIESDIYGARVDTSGTVLDPSGIAVSIATEWQSSPSVIHGASGYLVVWIDGRSGAEPDIYGARVTSSGTVLDSSGIGISTEVERQYFPSVSYDGTNYLVVWYDYRSGTDIYGSRVDTLGAVLEPSGIVISARTEWQGRPSVCFGETEYLVVWDHQGWGTAYDIHGARVDTSGTVVDSSDILISTAPSWQWLPSAGSDGTNYLVVWTDTRNGGNWDMCGARVDASGTMLDSSAIAISTADGIQAAPSVSFDGANYFVVWLDEREADDWDIYGARLDLSGTVLDPLGIAICSTADWQWVSSVAFDGINHLVVWHDSRSGTSYDIYGARVDTSGMVLDPLGIPICTTDYFEQYPSVCFGGTNYLVVWEEYRNGTETDIYGTRLDTSGAVLDPSPTAICTARYDQTYPSVASSEGNYFVVWQDGRSTLDWDIFGARLDTSGTVLDPSGVGISTVPNDQTHPSVSFDGTNYFLVWEDSSIGENWDIYGARVDTSGVVLDPGGIELVNKVYDRLNPSIAVGAPGQLLLVYDGFADEPYNTNRVFGAFYTETGIGEHKAKIKNQNAKLFQNRPNPFHSQTEVQYNIPASGHTSLKVYDSSGRLVSVLVDEEKPAGSHASRWDGKDSSGHGVPSGVYFCRLQTGEFVSTRKMILVR